MRKLVLAIVSLGALLGAPLAALAQAGPKMVTADIPSGEYALDSKHAAVIWQVKHFGLSRYTARFDGLSGTINWVGDKPETSSVSAEIDATSVSTGLPTFDDKIEAQVFKAAEFPKITFASTGIALTGTNTGKITGNLTIAGVTKPVTLDTTFNGGMLHPFQNKWLLGFSAKTSFKRSDWGLNNWAGAVSDEVELQIEGEWIKK